MIDGVVELARRTGLPRIVIGATIISLGTTTPEAVVSVMAAWMGNGLALGNAVGSIIADTGLIFGLNVPADCRTCKPVYSQSNRLGSGLVGDASCHHFGYCPGHQSRGTDPESMDWFFPPGLVSRLHVHDLYLGKTRRQYGHGKGREDNSEFLGLGKCWFMLLGGLFLVVLGARILVPSASEIACRLGVPDDIIACTMVAFGTSLPELMTAISAVKKGHPEIMVGNMVGADVLNCLFVIGAAAAARPLAIPSNFFVFHFPPCSSSFTPSGSSFSWARMAGSGVGRGPGFWVCTCICNTPI